MKTKWGDVPEGVQSGLLPRCKTDRQARKHNRLSLTLQLLLSLLLPTRGFAAGSYTSPAVEDSRAPSIFNFKS